MSTKGQPREGRAEVYAEKAEHMVREHDAADHQKEHRGQQQDVHCELKHAVWRIPAPERGFVPPGVERVVGDEQSEHACADPLVRRLGVELVAHLEEQPQRHERV